MHSSIFSLFGCKAFQRCATRSSCTASQASLCIRKVDYSFGLGKDRRNNPAHRIGKIKGHHSTFIRSSTSIRLSTCMTSSDFVPETTTTRLFSWMCRSRLVTNVYSSPLDRETHLWQDEDLYFQGTTAISRHEQAVPNGGNRLAFPVLLLKSMRVYVVERFKLTAGHWGYLHTFL